MMNSLLVSNKEEPLLLLLENYHLPLPPEMLLLNTLEIGLWDLEDGLLWPFLLMDLNTEFPLDLCTLSLLLAVETDLIKLFKG
jgi:hypothetical protein